jgi:hypothetical protein
MRIIVLPLAASVVLAAASVQAAPVPNTRHAKSHETPAQNVRKSQQYDHLVSTNPGFRAARMKQECGPLRDPGLRSSCLASFGEYEPANGLERSGPVGMKSRPSSWGFQLHHSQS